MPMTSDEFNAMPAAIRSFYSNCNQRYLGLCEPHFATLGYVWYPRSALGLANHNRNFQYAYLGKYNDDSPFVYENYIWDFPADSIPINSDGLDFVSDQFELVPAYSYEYPAARVRTRKSYWTGISRRRRNRT